jgi:UDP-N-acetylglucosamine diphosphorylase/glucosamine-1-phosphate N-acetyltransferase
MARRCEPFALSRPLGEVRAGALLIRERWTRVLAAEAVGWCGSGHLKSFSEFDAPAAMTDGAVLPAGTVVVNTRCIPALVPVPGAAGRWLCDGHVAGVRLREATPVSVFADGTAQLNALSTDGPDLAIDGWWLERSWDLIRHLTAMLTADITQLGRGVAWAPAHVTILGSHPVFVEEGAAIEPFVVCDATTGPILVRRGAQVSAFTRLVGPCMIGIHSHVLGGRVTGSSIGDHCRVQGEMSTSILFGHANKGHDGFVGHSVLGRWANLGAGTTTSNLKNTYGQVQAWAPDGAQDTGMQFLGTLVGDHAKTAIGTRLSTGTVVGTGANVLTAGLSPKVIAPFAFGEETYRLDKFLDVAFRVMARRQVALDSNQRACLAAVHAARWSA